MRHAQATTKQHKIEEELVAWIEAKPTQELSQFLAGAWTASILSPEAIEKLYQYRQRRQKEEVAQPAFR